MNVCTFFSAFFAHLNDFAYCFNARFLLLFHSHADNGWWWQWTNMCVTICSVWIRCLSRVYTIHARFFLLHSLWLLPVKKRTKIKSEKSYICREHSQYNLEQIKMSRPHSIIIDTTNHSPPLKNRLRSRIALIIIYKMFYGHRWSIWQQISLSFGIE